MIRYFAVVFTLLASPVTAECSGTDSLSNCWDEYGNNYTVHRMGDLTLVNGFNNQTNSHWTQTSHTIGNIVIHSGVDADGNNWNMTQHFLGDFVLYSGIDSDGNSFSYTCDQFDNCY